MRSRDFWTGLGAAAGMLVLILDSQTALAGMRDGIELCLRTLIPSLFPFFFLSVLLTGNLLGSRIKIMRPIGQLCGIPEGAESLLAVGLLGGYPVGAQNVALAYESGSLSKTDAQRLLSFCSNAGPAFLFGIVGAAFDSPWIPWALWAVHMASALIVGMAGNCNAGRSAAVHRTPVSLTGALQKALSVMAQVSGWVIIFRMLLTYLDRWFLWLLPNDAKILLSGILELSNGCIQLRELENEGLRFLTAAVLLALGGLCVCFQTSSVAKGLSLKYYFPGKLLQAVLSVLMAMCMQSILPLSQKYTVSPFFIALLLLCSLILVWFLRKQQNSSRIPAPVVV